MISLKSVVILFCLMCMSYNQFLESINTWASITFHGRAKIKSGHSFNSVTNAPPYHMAVKTSGNCN